MQLVAPTWSSETIFLTKNTEYHLRDRFCFEIRDRRTGKAVGDHAALHRELAGSVRFLEDEVSIRAGLPAPGDAMCFRGDLITSPVLDILVC